MKRLQLLFSAIIVSATVQTFGGDRTNAMAPFASNGPVDHSFGDEAQLSKAAAWAESAGNGIHFQENLGQVKDMNGDAAPYVRFMLERGGAKIFLLEQGIAWQFERVHYPEGYTERKAALQDGVHDQAMERIAEELARLEKEIRLETYRMDMTLVGADPHARVTTDGRSNDYTNYYNHNVLDVHHYRRVRYHDVYPGIDWVVYTTEAGMKYDFELQPGADPSLIKLRFSHHEELYLDEKGRLVVGNRMGQFVEEAPVSFQDGKKISTIFILHGDTLVFGLEGYDTRAPLTIDPERIWATYYGGIGIDNFVGCAVDESGNVVTCGNTSSNTNIAFQGHQNIHPSIDIGAGLELLLYNNLAFVVKFSSNGTRQWATYYGGSTGSTSASSCATGPDGSVFLAGASAGGSDLTFNGFNNDCSQNPCVFFVKFNGLGIREWATCFPAFVVPGNNGIPVKVEIDSQGNSYLLGQTIEGVQFSYNGYQNNYGGGQYDYGLVKFDSEGGREWATYIGGEGAENFPFDLHIDTFDNVYVGGNTESFANIALNGHQMFHGEVGQSAADAFLMKLNSSGQRIWGTYYGGNGGDGVNAIWTDELGFVYAGGVTSSNINIWQNGLFQGGPSFIVKFDSTCVRQWGTYTPGNVYDGASDGAGYFFIAGIALSNNSTYQAQNIMYGIQPNHAGNSAANWILTKWNSMGVPIWGTYYGSSVVYMGSNDRSLGQCAADGQGGVYLAGGMAGGNLAWQGHQVGWSAYSGNFLGPRPDGLLVKFACIPSSSTTELTACDSYEWNENTYTQTGSYTFETVTAFGCDSTAVLNLTIATANTAFTLQGSTVTANATDGNYQWVDCNNGNAPILGATGQSFTPEVSGSYAVEVTQNGCVGLSACVFVTVVGIEENETRKLSIRPNPSDGLLYVEVGTGLAGAPYTVVDALGHIVQTGRLEGTRKVLDLNDAPAGIYSITLGDGFKVTERIVKL